MFLFHMNDPGNPQFTNKSLSADSYISFFVDTNGIFVEDRFPSFDIVCNDIGLVEKHFFV